MSTPSIKPNVSSSGTNQAQSTVAESSTLKHKKNAENSVQEKLDETVKKFNKQLQKDDKKAVLTEDMGGVITDMSLLGSDLGQKRSDVLQGFNSDVKASKTEALGADEQQLSKVVKGLQQGDLDARASALNELKKTEMLQKDGMTNSEVSLDLEEGISVSQQTLMPSTDMLFRAQVERTAQAASLESAMTKGALPTADVHSTELIKESIHAQLHIKSRDNAQIDVQIQNNELKVNIQSVAESGKPFDAGALADLRAALEQKYPHLNVHIGMTKDPSEVTQSDSAASSQQNKRDRQDQQGGSQQQQQSHDTPNDLDDEYYTA